MKILVINSGSSSIKYQLFSMAGPVVLASGIVEKIGESQSIISHQIQRAETIKHRFQETIPDHKTGMDRIVELITDQTLGVLKNKGEVAAVGHRVVHGGETFKAPTVIDDAVLIAIKENSLLAPLHNPANVTGIEVARTVFKKAIQVAVFDTAFHHTIPPKAHLYALPYELYKTMKIRRYGFHGTSHQFVAETAAKILNRRLEELNLITIHLGNGGSITAVKNGKSIDTSMGMTPLEGLIMGTRSGDIDPAIPFYINNNSSLSMKEIDGILNKHSGLKGICGRNDMREIMSARDNGDEQAKLAIEMYCYRIKKYIGAYLAVLGKVDALIFTAGIGEHSPEIRRIVCEGLENLGIRLDGIKNFENRDGVRELHTNESNIKILLVPTNEELKIALATQEIFKAL
jgi:acetate kinase